MGRTPRGDTGSGKAVGVGSPSPAEIFLALNVTALRMYDFTKIFLATNVTAWSDPLLKYLSH